MRKKILLLFYLVPCLSFGQNQAPAKVSNIPLYVYNATIHTGTGQVLKKSSILVENGIFTKINSADNTEIPSDAIKIDIKGKNIYPGIITPNSNLGLQEIEAVRTTHDFYEIGNFNPEIRTLIAYNTDSEIIPTVRSNGILISQATPIGGLIAGRSSVFNLDGWNWEDAVLKADDGLWITWPSIKSEFKKGEIPDLSNSIDDYQKLKQELQSYFKNAKNYSTLNNAKYDIKYEAIKDIFIGGAKLYIRIGKGLELVEAVEFCKELNLNNYVIVGYNGIEENIELLKDNSVPILLRSSHQLPEFNDSEIWGPYELPKKLVDAGLLVGLYFPDSGWRTKNIIFNAGTAAAFGLSKEQALQLITLNTAKILGIDNFVGSIEIGKKATFLICEGDILDMKTSKIEKAYINGNEIDLDNKLKRLSRKYIEKYGIEEKE